LYAAAPLRAYSTNTNPSALVTDFGTAETDKGDILITFHPDSTSETGLTTAAAAAADLTVASHSFADGEVLVAYDCQRSVVFQKTGGTSTTIAHGTGVGTPGNCQAAFATSCSSGTSFGLSAGGFVSRLTVEAFYIAPAPAGGGSSLWRRRLQGGSTVAEELVRHIEGLRVRFGLDTNGDQAADTYVRPAAVAMADWPKVVSTRLELLAVSDEPNLASTAQTGIRLDGDAADRTTTDRRLYRIYSSTINLRNRTL
jgi:type IV pilus assembly protein PilW